MFEFIGNLLQEDREWSPFVMAVANEIIYNIRKKTKKDLDNTLPADDELGKIIGDMFGVEYEKKKKTAQLFIMTRVRRTHALFIYVLWMITIMLVLGDGDDPPEE